ncbi:MAG: hypothetical protein LBH59_03635 [Planctomycetaceae bacterium]|nr:hypothetical protein [Planctomycetaceae bacterium]
MAALVIPQDATYAAKISRWRHFRANKQVQVKQPDLDVILAKIKSNPAKPKDSDLIRCKKLLLKECNKLINTLAKDSDREEATSWRVELGLDSLREHLTKSGLPDFEVIKNAWNNFNQDKTGLRWERFNGVRNELRRYLTIHALSLLGDDYNEQIAKVCDSYENMVQNYISTASPVTGATLNDLTMWFNDISLFESRASQVVSVTRKKVSLPNIRFAVSERFMSNGFNRNLSRDIDVNETIQGTRIIGSGSMTGTSSSSVVTRSQGAAIDIIVDAQLETETKGYHSPVTLNTHTTGKLLGKKRILLSPDKFFTLPATSTADLKADIYNVRVNAGALVSCIARRQVEDQREGSLEEATLRAEARLNDQINAIVDAELKDANEQYQKSFRRPLQKLGLLPEFSISSVGADADKGTPEINGYAVVGTTFQPNSATNAPDFKDTFDVFVQLHQSFPNNIAAFAFAGKHFDESKSNLSEQLGELESLKQIFERKDEQDPIAITFADKAPTVVTFEEDVVRIVVRINSFFQNETQYPGLDITLVYKVKTEKAKDGSFVVVLEQLEKPDAMPRGRTNVSARVQTIRTVVLRRLESVPKRVELKPFGLKWKGWQDSGELKPVFIKSTNGWLTIGFNWIQKS